MALTFLGGITLLGLIKSSLCLSFPESQLTCKVARLLTDRELTLCHITVSPYLGAGEIDT